MKANFTIDLDDYGCCECGGANEFANDMLNRVAHEILSRTDKDAYDWEFLIDKKIEGMLQYASKTIEQDVMSKFQKESVAAIVDSVSSKLEEKVERSKSFKVLQNELQIQPEGKMKAELRAMIQEIVKDEVRKLIRI
jgi:ABC-type lipoprotein release transport system permease subunit